MIELITFSNIKNSKFLNYSPFCTKVEVFLKLNNIEFVHTEFNGPLKKFPKQKLPVIKDSSHTIPDSSLILDYLSKKYELSIDDHLTEEQKSIGTAYQSLLEEHLYWAIVAERWLVESNWKIMREKVTQGIPKPMNILVGKIVRNITTKNLMGHGFGRFDENERFEIAKKLIKNLSHFLGDKSFALGDKVSSYDATFYATISNLIYADMSPRLSEEAQKYSNFSAYCERVFQLIS